MPESTSVLFKQVLPGHKPSDDDLLKILTDRAEFVASFLDRFTLPKLGDVEFIPSGFGHGVQTSLYRLGADKVTDPLAGLSTQGFYMQVWTKEDDGAKYHLIGFSRDGAWLEVIVEEKHIPPATHEISKVTIRCPFPNEIVQKYLLTYRDLLDLLSAHMRKSAEASRERHQRLQYAADRFEQEDLILKAMCAKPEDVRR